MNAPCSTISQNDGCLQCPHGTFMDVFNNDTNCKRCYPSCDGGKVTVQNCTSTSNRLCQCPTTKYWDTVLHICRDCTKCENGQRKVEYCSSEHDSVCQDCPEVRILGLSFALFAYICLHAEYLSYEFELPKNDGIITVNLV